MADVKGITKDRLLTHSWRSGDEWTGTAEELIDAHLITRDQLPGEPGNNKVRVTYYCEVPVGKGRNSPHDENYLSIERYGKQKFIVRKGISEEEKRRRETKEILLKKSPDVDFSSLPPALFYVGEKVWIEASGWHGIVKVVDIRYGPGDQNNSRGYAYQVDPNLSHNYAWFMEELLYKYIMEPASIIALPGAAKEPVQQPRRYGRFPKSIASLWDARRERWHRDEDLKKLRDKLRAINWQIDANQIVLTKEQARLIEVKKQIQELTK